METTTSKQAEVALGESHEQRIAENWIDGQMLTQHLRLVKAGQYDDFDFWVFDREGILVCYLEVKKRRKPLSAFGDVMVPKRKHDLALRVRELTNTRFLAVTEYACGALVEVDLATEPTFFKNIRRRDRPNTPAVPHALYGKDKMKVLRVG